MWRIPRRMQGDVVSATALVPLRDVAASGLTQDAALALAQLACSQLRPNTQRAYIREITLYLARGTPLTREHIALYLSARRDAGTGSVTLNTCLAALKLLCREAELRGLLPPNDLNAIERLKGQKIRGQRLGNWTDTDGIDALLKACQSPRERALIAILCGCGLRRSEVAGLTWEQYQERAGRMALVDIVGKGGRVRSVAVPWWAAEILDEYKENEL